MRRTTKVIWGTLAGVLQIVIAIGLQIVLMPLILHWAGQDVLGVYAVILQIIGYLALIDVGISTALSRSLSQTVNDPPEFRALMSSGFYFLTLLGGVYALIGSGLAFGLGDLLHLPQSLSQQARTATLLLAGWGLLRFPLAIFSAGLLAMQDLTVPPLLGVLSNAIRLALSVVVVQAGLGVTGLIGANILAEALLAGSLLLRFQQLRPGWSIQLRNLDIATLKELARFGLQAFWGNLAGRVILHSDNIVVGNLYGAAAASVYYNTQTPISIPYNLVFRLANNAMPGINELWARREWSKLRDIFLRLQRLTLLMIMLISIGGWFYLEATIKIWVGPSQFGGQRMTLWLVLFAAMISASHVPQVFVYASGDIRRFSQLTMVEAINNLGLSFLLGAWFGLHGVALATTIAHIPTTIYLQVRAHRDLKITWRDWARQTLWPVLLAALPTALVAGLMINLAQPKVWEMLVYHGLIIGVVHLLSIYLLGLQAPDRAVVLGLIRSSVLRLRFTERVQK